MTLRRISRSPLVHFFVLGGLIFALFAALNDEPTAAPTRDTILLTPGEAQRLANQFSATWRRQPTPEELNSLMQDWAEEEAFAREAVALGLDQGDAIIQRRLSQKMQFLAESAAGSLVPDDDTLSAYLNDHREDFTQPANYALEQVLLAEDADDANLGQIRSALEQGTPPSALGRATLLPTYLPLTPAPAIDGLFGEGFHGLLAPLALGRWEGPVASAHGQHLIKVVDRTAAALSPLSDIRQRVEAKWRADKTREMREEFARGLLDRYAIVLPSTSQVLEP